MSGERALALMVLASLAIGTAIVGWLGGRGSIRFALGGHADEGPDQPAAQRAIGRWFVAAGVCAGAAAVKVAIGPESWVGPTTVVGSVAVAVLAMAAVVAGVRRVE